MGFRKFIRPRAARCDSEKAAPLRRADSLGLLADWAFDQRADKLRHSHRPCAISSRSRISFSSRQAWIRIDTRRKNICGLDSVRGAHCSLSAKRPTTSSGACPACPRVALLKSGQADAFNQPLGRRAAGLLRLALQLPWHLDAPQDVTPWHERALLGKIPDPAPSVFSP